MDPLAKVSVQVHLFPEQLAELQAMADRWHVSVEDIIRQSIGSFLFAQENPPPAEPQAGLSPEEETGEKDSLWDIIGIGESDVTDLAENHDKYLVEFEEASNHSWPDRSSSANAR